MRPEPGVTISQHKVLLRKVLLFWNKYSMYIILLALLVVSSLVSDVFLTRRNIINLLRQVSINGIISMGMLIVILTGGIDLSVGSVLALAGGLVAGLQRHLPLYQAIGLAMFFGILPGIVTGFFISKLKMAPFIMSLAMMTIARGSIMIYMGGTPIQITNMAFARLGAGSFWIIPYPVIAMLSVATAVYFLLNHTVYGRQLVAIGNNEQAARLAGIPVARVKILAYTISAALSSLAGIILTSRLYIAEPMAGSAFELDAIAACTIGGASLSGGIGNVPGTFIGVIILGLINNVMNLMNVQSYPQQVIKGLIIIAAIVAKMEMDQN